MDEACKTCGMRHVSKAGKPLTHRQWERNQKLKESGKGTQVVAGAPPGGGKRGVRKRRPIDFADRIEIAFRASGGQKAFNQFAKENPKQFYAQFVGALAVKQMAKEEAKPIEQDDGLEELEAFKKRWEEFEPPQVVTSDHLVNQPVNGELAPEQVDAIATGVRPQVG